MNIWHQRAAHFGPQPDLRGFTASATPNADAWRAACPADFMSHPDAAHGAEALMAGLRFYTPAFVTKLKALPSAAARQPPLTGRIPRAIYTTTGPLIVDVYQNLISHNARHSEIQAAFMQAMSGLINQYNVITH